MDSDYPKARELLETQILIDANLAKIQFEEEWKSKWNSSYAYWFFGSMREDPLKIFRLIALIAIVCIFIWYPIHTILN